MDFSNFPVGVWGSSSATTKSSGPWDRGVQPAPLPDVDAGGEHVIYNFEGSPSDAIGPYAALSSDGKGGAYGTTIGCGAIGGGTVYHIAP